MDLRLTDFFTMEFFKMMVPSPLARLAVILYVLSYILEVTIKLWYKPNEDKHRKVFELVRLITIAIFVIGWIFR